MVQSRAVECKIEAQLAIFCAVESNSVEKLDRVRY